MITLVLDSDADQAPGEVEQVAGAGEGVALIHVHEVEKVRHVGFQQLEGMADDTGVRATFGDD
jgi:hypothetical protein